MNYLSIQIKTLPHFEGLELPAYETTSAAGMDLRCACSESLVIQPGERKAVPTGIAMAIPAGYEGQVRPRSGLALKKGVGIINSPGTIDADYRGEILVPLINLGKDNLVIERGMRIAQLIIAPVMRVVWEEVSDLSGSARGAGGFGHTGTR